MTDRAMLDWQYRSLLGELQLLQGHAESPDCPCSLTAIGEFCLQKHALNVSSLSGETAAMDSTNAQMLYELQEAATEMHVALKAGVCGHGEDQDVVAWARDWRKRIEPLYYACEMKAEQPRTCTMEAQPCRMEGAMTQQCTMPQEVGEMETDPILSEIARQICTGGVCVANPDSEKPICSPKQARKLERCIVKVKKRQPKSCKGEWHKEPEEMRPGCANPWRVCSETVGCRPGRAR